MPAMPKVAKHNEPKNTSAPRVLREQFGTISIRSCKLLATLGKARPSAEGRDGTAVPCRKLQAQDLFYARDRDPGKAPRGGTFRGLKRNDIEQRRRQTCFERGDVFGRVIEARLQMIGDPAGEREAAGFDRLSRQQGMVEAAEPKADDEKDGQVEGGGDVGHGLHLVDGREPTAGGLDDDQVRDARELAESLNDRRKFQGDAFICRRNMG